MGDWALGRSYRLYGLDTCSQLHLPVPELSVPELSPQRPPDVTIRTGLLTCAPGEHVEPHCYCLRLPDRGFRVEHGREMVVDMSYGPLRSRDMHFILGRCFAALLLQRRRLVLHASVVADQQGALALMGPRGQGKSTLAAALYRAGYRVLADDHCLLSNTSEPWVEPAFAALKLTPAMAAHFQLDPLEPLPGDAPSKAKLFAHCGHGEASLPAPLRAIFILGSSDHENLQPLHPLIRPAAAHRLLEGVFAPRMAAATLGAETLFHLTAELAMCVPVFALGPQVGLDRLDERVAAIEATVRSLPRD